MHFLFYFSFISLDFFIYLSLINAVSTRFHTHIPTHCIHNVPVTLILRIYNYIFFSKLRHLMRLPQIYLLYHYFNSSFIAFNLLLFAANDHDWTCHCQNLFSRISIIVKGNKSSIFKSWWRSKKIIVHSEDKWRFIHQMY